MATHTDESSSTTILLNNSGEPSNSINNDNNDGNNKNSIVSQIEDMNLDDEDGADDNGVVAPANKTTNNSEGEDSTTKTSSEEPASCLSIMRLTSSSPTNRPSSLSGVPQTEREQILIEERQQEELRRQKYEEFYNSLFCETKVLSSSSYSNLKSALKKGPIPSHLLLHSQSSEGINNLRSMSNVVYIDKKESMSLTDMSTFQASSSTSPVGKKSVEPLNLKKKSDRLMQTTMTPSSPGPNRLKKKGLLFKIKKKDKEGTQLNAINPFSTEPNVFDFKILNSPVSLEDSRSYSEPNIRIIERGTQVTWAESKPTLCHTYSRKEYERGMKGWVKPNEQQKILIRDELQKFKHSEMTVHPESRKYTNFHLARPPRPLPPPP